MSTFKSAITIVKELLRYRKDLITQQFLYLSPDCFRAESTVPFRCSHIHWWIMAREFAKGFYQSEAWHRTRLGYIRHRRSVDGGMCEECGENPGYIVHHKIHLNQRNINDPEVTLSFSNLEYVCKACHDRLHEYCGREEIRSRKIFFDSEGNPVEVPPLKTA